MSSTKTYPLHGDPVRWHRDAHPLARGEVLGLAYALRQDGSVSDSEWTRFGREGLALTYELVEADNLDGFLAFMAEDVEFNSLIAEAEGEVYRGHSGIRRWWARVPRAFKDLHYELLGFWRYGEESSVARLRVTGNLGGVPVEQVMWQATMTRAALCIWWGIFRSREDAVAALAQRNGTVS
jgi:SnoaL-like domain